jgi:hypothetical protein
MESNANNTGTRRRGKRDKSAPSSEEASPEVIVSPPAFKKIKIGREQNETPFGELVHRIVSETENTHPHLIRFTKDGAAFRVGGPRQDLAPIMMKYFPRKYCIVDE